MNGCKRSKLSKLPTGTILLERTMNKPANANRPVTPTQTTPKLEHNVDPNSPEAVQARRDARKAAMTHSFGMWKDDPTKPKDGVAFQKKMRAEW